MIGLDVWHGLNSGTVTRQYGVKVNMGGSGAVVGTKYGVYIDNSTGAATTSNYGVYQVSGAASNYFAGKVGIGISPSAYPLTVQGLVESVSGDGVEGGFRFPDGTIQRTAADGASAPITAANVSAGPFPVGEFMFPGSVGIGSTATPQALLHLRATDSAYEQIESSAGHAGLMLKSASGITNLIKTDASNGQLAFEAPNGTPRMVINYNNGAIGIGTPLPLAPFQVRVGTNENLWVRDLSSKLQLGALNDAGNAYTAIAIEGSTLTLNQNGGNVAIGTTTSADKLTVSGVVSATGGVRFPDGNVQMAAWTGGGGSVDASAVGAGTFPIGDFTFQGKVGIGYAGAATALDVTGAAQVNGAARRVVRFFDNSDMAAGVGGGIDFLGKYSTAGAISLFANMKGVKSNGTSGDFGGDLVFSTDDANGSVIERMRIGSTGQVVIAASASNPTALEVGGAIHAAGAISSSTAIYATYQDLAEWVPSTETLEPGTVVVLDPAASNHVMASTSSYDTSVAGVVSKNPGIVLGLAAADKAKVATTGRVKVRVDATIEPIKIGDLLVTSDKLGVAMKSVPMQINGRKFHQPGTVIGKALEPIASGEGEILVLLSLQ
jgi:hypothetical protein